WPKKCSSPRRPGCCSQMNCAGTGGLLWVDPNRGAELVRDGKPRSCQPTDQMKLLNNILASTMDMILSAPVPRRRKPKRTVQAQPAPGDGDGKQPGGDRRKGLNQ
ncbi:MAG TPA: hypothetical protein PKY10_04150, partial [Lentisphaeria bacterium]|nr:hypothetical protein [Lentisphaeria bacterium]